MNAHNQAGSSHGRRICTWASLGIGGLTFFLPLLVVHAPIVGNLEWSTLNVVSEALGVNKKGSPSFSGMVSKRPSNTQPEDDKAAEVSQTSVPTDHATVKHEVPLAMRLAACFPFTVLVSYMTLVAAVGTMYAYSPKILVFLGRLGLASAVYSLIAIFLLSDSLHSEMTGYLAPPSSNPFSQLGEALAQSFRIEPGSGLYILTLCFLLLLLVQYLVVLDRVSLSVN